MKVAIVGATSFIGKNLTTALNNAGDDIFAVVRENSKKKCAIELQKNVYIVECNMENYDTLGGKIGSIDSLVYLTWDGTRGKDRDNYEKQKKNYYWGMQAIQSIINVGCHKIITAGSQAEYGPWFKQGKLSEKELENPNTEYGKFKLKFYRDLNNICKKNNILLIEPRFFSLYGPGDFFGTMIISMLICMLKNKPCNLTTCKQIWDFLYIDDAINGLIKLIKSTNIYGVYNFGSGESHQLKYYIEKMYEITHSSSQLNYGAIPYPVTGMVNVNPCVEKLKNIGWAPNVSFEEGIKKIIESDFT